MTQTTSLTLANCVCTYGNSTYTGSASASSSATANEPDPSIGLLSQNLAIEEVLQSTYNEINTTYLNNNYQINMTINTSSYVTNLSNIIYVTNLNDSGEGSFRQAIIQSNSTTPTSHILFNVVGQITLLSDLDVITSPAIIDGISETNYTDMPLINVNCNGYNSIVFESGSDYSSLFGLSITNALSHGIKINSTNITLDKNYILFNGENGVYINESSSYNTIGLNTENSSTIKSNLISGNKSSGIYLSNTSNNMIQNNYIGTNESGTISVPNLKNGIEIIGSKNNTIGGKIFTNSDGITNNPTGTKGTITPTFIKLPLGNIISGNERDGIKIKDSTDNYIYGNFIGTTKDGNGILGNGNNGVYIDNSENINIIGCEVYNEPFVYYNVISGNKLDGLYVLDSLNITVQGNFFGINAQNSSLLPNLNGINVDGISSYIQIGGVIPLGNVCSGNKYNGIYVNGETSNLTSFNTFGGLFAFGGAAPNGKDGIYVTSKKYGNLIRTCVLSGNLGNGINLNGAENVQIDPVMCGVFTDGKSPLPNGKNGLLIQGDSNHNIITNTFFDNPSVITTNIFSGNTENGILIKDTASFNRIFNAIVGLNVFGTTETETTSVGNNINGILITDKANTNIIDSCLISNNNNDGIVLLNDTYKNIISNNQIGYELGGIQAAPNLNDQVNNNNLSNIVVNNNIYS